jgi:transcriptional regulator with XRE-family HTH domain
MAGEPFVEEDAMNRDNSFGQQVRQHRRALDLTQDELARRVGCAAITLRKIEAGAARPSQQIAERLAMALAIPLDERAEFVRQARAALVPADRVPEPTVTPQVVPEEIGAEDLSGRAIRTYTLHDKIGAGAFGVVYRAVQPLVEREVAIKIILPQYANHPDFIRRFEAEAQLVARLEHPHIVPLYDYWRDPGVAYLVMRLLRGGNVQELLQQGALPVETTRHIIDQIGAALHSAHRAGVVHRDLKPSNVLLDEESNAYLADFGIAKNLGNPETQTQVGMVIGSPAYMSPEQINSEPIRPQADIYSLGVMLYELLTGSRPFLGPTPIDLIQQHLYAALPPLAANRSGLPEAFNQIIAHATAKDPLDRYADVDQLLADFHEVLQTGRLRTVPLVACPPIELANPYKGLRAFEEADAPDFFGREALTQQLLTRLGEGGDLNRFLAVIGPSGSGKSSVVKAGLLPALRRGGLVGSENWFVITLTPGPHPLEELEAALLRIAVNPPESLLKQLREDERGLLRAIKRTLPAEDDIELVLIIDQFEEVFTLVDDEAERAQLLDSLVATIMDEHSRVRVIITLRADFIDRPLRYVDFGELMQRRSELVLPLTPDELERAIVGPANRVGLQLEPGLAEAISADVIEQPGALPLLQYALTELYDRRSDHKLTKAAYQTIGGVRGALGRRAEEVFTTLDPGGQAAAQQMFLRLVTLGEGTEDVRRRVQRGEVESLSLDNGTQTTDEVAVVGGLSSVVDVFGKARLLTFDRDLQTRGPTLEVAHEALLREWPRLHQWLNENRADIRLQRQLAAETIGWLEADRDASFLLRGSRLQQFEDWAQTTSIALTADERSYLRESLEERQRQQAEEETRQAHEIDLERRARRVLQILAGVALIAAIVGGGLAIAANLQRVRAEAAEARAVNEAQVRATQQAVAEANFTRAEAQRLGAEAYRLLKTDGSAELIALLTLHSLKMQYSPQGDAALTGAVALALPEMLFTGHTQGVTAVAFSPDGQSILTGSKDNTVRL